MTEPMHAAADQPDIFADDADDTGSIDAVLRALYEGLSFPPDGGPDWERVRRLFLPTARLFPPRADANARAVGVDLDTWISESTQSLRSGRSPLSEGGFQEDEVSRRTHRYANIAQVFSVYQAKHYRGEDPLLHRGVNAVQLVRSHGRWWITSILWAVEREESPLPADLL